MYVNPWLGFSQLPQIFIAEVVDDGDGKLTATYESSFPGQYLVYIEEGSFTCGDMYIFYFRPKFEDR